MELFLAMRHLVERAYVEMKVLALATLQARHFDPVAALTDCSVEIHSLHANDPPASARARTRLDQLTLLRDAGDWNGAATLAVGRHGTSPLLMAPILPTRTDTSQLPNLPKA
jgi:hypothetical protein